MEGHVGEQMTGWEYIYIYIYILLRVCGEYTRRFLTFLTASRHVRFAAAGASLAESRARVLPMNQSSDGLQS
jgi:hypothetical protein